MGLSGTSEPSDRGIERADSSSFKRSLQPDTNKITSEATPVEAEPKSYAIKGIEEEFKKDRNEKKEASLKASKEISNPGSKK